MILVCFAHWAKNITPFSMRSHPRAAWEGLKLQFYFHENQDIEREIHFALVLCSKKRNFDPFLPVNSHI